jgi:hypothetical protein
MDHNFWWTWWVQVAAAVATFAAVFVALFGDWVRARLFQPELELELVDPKGEFNEVTIKPPHEVGRKAKARYYHVLVRNKWRWPAATGVQLFLIRVEEPGPDGALQIRWTGDVPMRWRHQEVHPLTRTVGASKDCDLFNVVEDMWFDVPTILYPNNLVALTFNRPGPVKMVVSVQAKAVEVESKVVRFEVSWDGKWSDGADEMAKNFIVKRL